MSTISLNPHHPDFGFEDRIKSNTGSSETSKDLFNIITRSLEELKQHTITWHQYNDATEELKEIYQDTRLDGWDGYSASIIPDKSFEIAQELINNLPTWLDFPEITPDTNGGISFQWTNHDCSKVFIMSIFENGVIHYASITGPYNKEHGTKLYDGAIPGEIIKKIQIASVD